jgi:hypothetical protein
MYMYVYMQMFGLREPMFLSALECLGSAGPEMPPARSPYAHRAWHRPHAANTPRCPFSIRFSAGCFADAEWFLVSLQ